MNTVIALFGLALLAITAGCERQPIDGMDGLGDENKAFVRRWFEEGFNRQSLAVVDELFAEQVSVNGQVVERDVLKGSMSRYLVGFPDLQVAIEDIVAEGSKVGVWYSVQGTHRGEFEGIPATGNHAKWSGFDLLTVEHGRITEARFLSDSFGLMTQLGARPQIPEGARR